MTFAGNTLPVKSRPPTYPGFAKGVAQTSTLGSAQRRISRTRQRDERPRERPQRWDWAPEREVVVGRTGNRLEDVLARCRALYGRGADQ
jgi:hypothetical protein